MSVVVLVVTHILGRSDDDENEWKLLISKVAFRVCITHNNSGYLGRSKALAKTSPPQRVCAV